ncbi:hypothetical protein [Nitrosospira sp. Nsp1]|uniref:hypothetical protein n=1 Tax=Nitrosospira sp. Nsp1 TaxID=136547 RepID=UPI00115FC595|nr:hypothetical protein [Nitrosospira sp. Nsp1]
MCRLHWIALSRKVINTLEFGSGYSTAILADAMRTLNGHFGEWVKKSIRSDNPFHCMRLKRTSIFVLEPGTFILVDGGTDNARF